jgi:hypothetical protein
MPGISQAKKIVILFSTILLLYGKVNLANLSRYIARLNDLCKSLVFIDIPNFLGIC